MLLVTVFLACAAVGLFLNILSLNILLNARFNQPVYFYIRVMIVSSVASNFVHILFAVVCSRYFLAIGNSYASQAALVFVLNPIQNTLTFYKFVVDALCTLERISKFRPRVARILGQSPRVNSTVALVLVIILLLSHYFYFWPYRYQTFSERDGFADL
jgi:hypothetical protein